MTLFSGFASLSSLCFSLKLRPFRSIVLRYAGAPIVTRVSFCFLFVYLEMSLFPSIFCTIADFSLNGEYVVRSFLPNNGVFLPCDHGLDFLHQLM